MADDTEFKFGTWYDIESAPKDGIEVLVYDPVYSKKGLICVASWIDDDTPGFRDAGWFDVIDEIPLRNVTHWMPLPPSPIPTKATEVFVGGQWFRRDDLIDGDGE